MILGHIFGKITTTDFQFIVEKETRKFEFVQVMHKVYDWVLCQVMEIERTDKDVARCTVIGYKDDKGRIKSIRIPFDQNSEVLRAEDDFVRSVIALPQTEKGAYVGKLEGKDIDIYLDLTKLLTKHVIVLAKSGSGKSYTTGVLVEEIIGKNVPIVIIDPHGEYSSLKHANTEEKENLTKFGLVPKAFSNVQEFGDPSLNPSLRPLKLNSELTPAEIIQLIPGKLSNTQLGILYSAIKHLDKINFTNVLFALDKEENTAKWTLINNLEYLKNLDIFTDSYSPYNELVQPGKCTVINLKGMNPDVTEILLYKLLKDLFELRKKDKVPPFFCVIEEAHNFCPERSFGEARCSKILRTVASEGRKFGLGLCLITQRPARIDKSVVSQCTTQIILKVTNPSDLKAIASSVEGITAESESEIKNLPIGSALITGIADMPLFVNIRPRLTQHGGHAVEMLEQNEGKFFDKLTEFEEKKMIPLVKPKMSPKDIELMSEKKVSKVETVLIPAYMFLCSEKGMEFNLLCEMENGEIVTDIETMRTKRLPELAGLSKDQIKVLHQAFKLGTFTEEDMAKQLGLGIGEVVASLVAQGLIDVDGSGMRLSEKHIFSHLSKVACYDRISFAEAPAEQMEPKVSLDSVKEKIQRFCTVKDVRECSIVKYVAVY